MGKDLCVWAVKTDIKSVAVLPFLIYLSFVFLQDMVMKPDVFILVEGLGVAEGR